MISSGILLFNQDLLDELGFGSDVFRMVLAVSALTGLLANFVGGWLAQKWPMGRLMGLAMFLMAVALATLPAARTRTHVLAYAIAMGVSGGIVTVVFFTCWGRMFGRRHLGKIQGAAQLMTVLASAAGPSLLALSEHTVGSYKPLLYGAAPVAGLLGVLCWVASEPRMSLATQTASEATFT